jgi:hypothetical protein
MNKKIEIANFKSSIFYLMDNVVTEMAKRARIAIMDNERYGDESAVSIFLEAFNQVQEDEFNGDYYIFNLNDKDDLKYLVDHEIFNACQIADLYPKCTASGLFRFALDINACPTGEIEIIGLDKLKEILCNNVESVIRFTIMYPEVYTKVYNLLIADTLIESDFKEC